MSKVPFSQRFGLEQSKPIDNDFPESAKIALTYLIIDLDGKSYLSGRDVHNELFRTGRFTDQDFDFSPEITVFDSLLVPLEKMKWWQIYSFCERVYDPILRATGYSESDFWVEETSLSEVRQYYVDELNNILAEGNLAYHFVDGQFQRRGRAQTPKSIQRMGAVLADPSLLDVRSHYN